MEMKEIYDHIEKVGCMSFSTLDNSEIHSRIAHFFAFDPHGFYFLTMNVKPFYRQLKSSGQLSVCGIYPSGRKTGKNPDGVPYFPPGFTFRMAGRATELTPDQVREKATAGVAGMGYALHDIEKYPATRIFCLKDGKGEIFDYDFEMENRGHKLLRTRFSFGAAVCSPSGVRITDDCVGCGECLAACTFKAIEEGEPFRVIPERCDECGSCIQACPEEAIQESDTI